MENNVIHTVTAEIILGNPSEGCQGHGICRILTQSLIKSLKCPSVTVQISSSEDNKLLFAFPKHGLSHQVREKHFNSLWFKMEEAVMIPGRLKMQFRLQRTHLQAGNYRIRENNHFYFIAL